MLSAVYLFSNFSINSVIIFYYTSKFKGLYNLSLCNKESLESEFKSGFSAYKPSRLLYLLFSKNKIDPNDISALTFYSNYLKFILF